MMHLTIRLLLTILVLAACDSNESNTTTNQLDDPYFKYQWYLNYTNNSFSTRYNIDNNAHINIDKAWELTYGEGIKVAIIDDSFEPSHEDIASNVVASYNFDDNNNDVTNHTDEYSHGHSCAGLIASTINGVGIAGVAPKAQLILIKQYESDDAKTIEAFEYAKQQGAKVISCSWGTYQVSEAVATKIQEIHDSGITIVFSFGNDAYNLDNSVNRTLTQVHHPKIQKAHSKASTQLKKIYLYHIY